MSEDRSDSSLQSYCNSSNCSNVTLSAALVTAILSPVAVVGNALVLAALWRNPSLRTPSYILLAGLALTDFGAGLITQPFYVVNELILLELIDIKLTLTGIIINVITHSCAAFFSYTTMLIITLMSVERWLHMTRRSLLTVRRTYAITSVLTALPIALAVNHVITVRKGTEYDHTPYIVFLISCLIVTSIAYFKLFRIIRRHQQQIQTSEVSHGFRQSSIDFAKYKKSVFSMLYILLVFYIGYLPMLISLLLFVALNDSDFTILFFDVSMVLLFLSSSLNPLLYLWRIKDIRDEVRQLVKRILCKNN